MMIQHLRDESRRIASLRRLRILDTPAEPAYDDIAQLAALICKVPIALISLLDEDRQWFKARIGLSMKETPRSVAFCAQAVERNDGLFLVPDAQQDDRFRENPLVTDDPNIRFYAGVPVAGPDGQPWEPSASSTANPAPSPPSNSSRYASSATKLRLNSNSEISSSNCSRSRPSAYGPTSAFAKISESSKPPTGASANSPAPTPSPASRTAEPLTKPSARHGTSPRAFNSRSPSS